MVRFNFKFLLTPLGAIIILLVYARFIDWLVWNPPWPTESRKAVMVKEAASMIAGAQAYHQEKGLLTEKTGPWDLVQHINYAEIDIQNDLAKGLFKWPWEKPIMQLKQCSERFPCLKLHNGGILQIDKGQSYGGTSDRHAIYFNYAAPPESPEVITFYTFYNGRLSIGGSEKLGKILTKNATLPPNNRIPEYIKYWDW